MTARDDKKVALPEPDVYKYQYWSSGPRVDWSRIKLDHTFSSPWSDGYVVGDPHFSFGKLESYAAARVAEATAEFQDKIAAERIISSSYKLAMQHETNRADELQRRVAELEANDRRYRFLRDNPSNHFFVTRHVGGATIARYEGRTLDETIDAILADREGGKA